MYIKSNKIVINLKREENGGRGEWSGEGRGGGEVREVRVEWGRGGEGRGGH
jgi:hypothetical protein